MDAFVLDARVRGWWIGYAPRKWTGGSKADLRRRGIAAPGSGVAALWVASRRNTLNVSATIVPPSRPAPPPVLTVGRKATVLQHHCYDPSELRHLRPLRRQSRTPSSSSTTYMRVQDGVPKLPSPSDGNGRRSAPPQRRQTAQESPALVASQPGRAKHGGRGRRWPSRELARSSREGKSAPENPKLWGGWRGLGIGDPIKHEFFR